MRRLRCKIPHRLRIPHALVQDIQGLVNMLTDKIEYIRRKFKDTNNALFEMMLTERVNPLCIESAMRCVEEASEQFEKSLAEWMRDV